MSNLQSASPKLIDFNQTIISDLNNKFQQPTAFINNKYNDELKIELEPIKITYYGIPPLSKPRSKKMFIKSDDDRKYINIPLDPNQQSCMQLKKILEDADNYYSSDAFKKKLFGPKKWQKYQYVPSIKYKNNDESEENNDLPPYCKIKCRVPYVIVKTNNDEINPDNMTEMTKYVKYKSTIGFTIKFTKIWANLCPTPGNNIILYGLGIDVIEINTCTFNKLNYYYIPVHTKEKLVNAYKKYIEEKKESKKKYITIEI